VVNLDLFCLTDTDRAANRLIHESGRPPRAHKDNAVAVLKIETRSPRLELNKENLLLATDKEFFGGLNGLTFLF
jgi:hypothetical protein